MLSTPSLPGHAVWVTIAPSFQNLESCLIKSQVTNSWFLKPNQGREGAPAQGTMSASSCCIDHKMQLRAAHLWTPLPSSLPSETAPNTGCNLSCSTDYLLRILYGRNQSVYHLGSFWAGERPCSRLFRVTAGSSSLRLLDGVEGGGFLGPCRCQQKSSLAPHGHFGLLGLHYLQAREGPGPLLTPVSLVVFLLLRQFLCLRTHVTRLDPDYQGIQFKVHDPFNF